MRIASPTPGFCSCCFAAKPDSKFVDFESAFDGQPVLDPTTGTIAVLPGQQAAAHDDLYLCEACIRQAAELVDHKPELHQRQLREIRRLQIENAHWKDTVRRARKELADQMDVNLGEPIKLPGRKPKELV